MNPVRQRSNVGDDTQAFRILGTDDYTTFRRTLLHDTGVSFCTRDHFGAPLPQEKEKYAAMEL